MINDLRAQLDKRSMDIDKLARRCQQADVRMDEINSSCSVNLDDMMSGLTQMRDSMKEEENCAVVRGAGKKGGASKKGKAGAARDSGVAHGKFSWQLDQWADKVKAARAGPQKHLYSDPFFSHETGYKMCLRVEPGDKFGISDVHLCLMRGPHDAQLQWPFNRDVSLALVGTQTRVAYESKLVKFADRPNDVGWTRPVSERNEPIGCLWFVPKFPSNGQHAQINIECAIRERD